MSSGLLLDRLRLRLGLRLRLLPGRRRAAAGSTLGLLRLDLGLLLLLAFDRLGRRSLEGLPVFALLALQVQVHRVCSGRDHRTEVEPASQRGPFPDRQNERKSETTPWEGRRKESGMTVSSRPKGGSGS